MRKEEFYVLNSLYNGSLGRAGNTAEIEGVRIASNQDVYNRLEKMGMIENLGKENICADIIEALSRTYQLLVN